MARTNSISTPKFTKMVIDRFVFLAACLLFVSAFLFQALSPVLANEGSEDKSVPDGTIFKVKAPEKKVFIGNLTSKNATNKNGTSIVTGPKDHQQFSTTSVTGLNDIDNNFVIASTGAGGQIRVGVSNSNQHEILDQTALLPSNLFDLFEKPTITYNKAYQKDSVVSFNYGARKAGKSVVLNYVAAPGAGTYVAYACQDGKPRKVSLTATNSRSQTSADIVKIGTDGKVCFTGDGSLSNLKITTLGYANFAVPAPERKLNLRSTNPDTLTTRPQVIKSGVANALALVHVTGRTTSPGSVSLYTSGKSPNGTILMSPNGRETETAFGLVMTDSNGQFTVSATREASYTVDVETIPLSSLGLTASMFDQKRVLNSETEYNGSNAKITSYKNNYVNNAELTMSCSWYSSDFGPNSHLSIKVIGLDPELSPDNGNIDSGTVDIRVTNIFYVDESGKPYEDVSWPKTDTKGRASSMSDAYFRVGEDFKAKTWYGTVKLMSDNRYATRPTGEAVYKVAVPCKKAN